MPESNEIYEVNQKIRSVESWVNTLGKRIEKRLNEISDSIRLIEERLDNTLGKYIKEEYRHIRIECEKCGKLLTRQNDGDIVGGDDGGNAIHKHWQCMEDYDRDYVEFFRKEIK